MTDPIVIRTDAADAVIDHPAPDTKPEPKSAPSKKPADKAGYKPFRWL